MRRVTDMAMRKKGIPLRRKVGPTTVVLGSRESIEVVLNAAACKWLGAARGVRLIRHGRIVMLRGGTGEGAIPLDRSKRSRWRLYLPPELVGTLKLRPGRYRLTSFIPRKEWGVRAQWARAYGDEWLRVDHEAPPSAGEPMLVLGAR
jgi:hypothetical protein